MHDTLTSRSWSRRSNRTFMELKCRYRTHPQQRSYGSNRTFMELKFAQSSRNPKDDGF